MIGQTLAIPLALLGLTQLAAASRPSAPTRLFAASEPIRFQLRGPISAIAQTPESSRAARAATLTLSQPAAETHSILLSPRGLTRRKRDTCEFPPLRVEFQTRPAATSLFDRQRRLKLVTHCRHAAGFQQHLLLEYAAYRMLNVLSSTALRARLASIDYTQDNGRPLVSRLGFFIEDPDDAARRNGLAEVRTTSRVSPSQLDPRQAAKVAVFEYMIGNLDWSMRAGPAGDTCCHNMKLMGQARASRTGLVPVPYDFDYSGLVNAPYAVPPDAVPVASVRVRRYRGYCIHNGHALAAAAEFRARRNELMAALSEVTMLADNRRKSAAAYLDGFFRDIATDDDVRKRVLRTCLS